TVCVRACGASSPARAPTGSANASPRVRRGRTANPTPHPTRHRPDRGTELVLRHHPQDTPVLVHTDGTPGRGEHRRVECGAQRVIGDVEGVPIGGSWKFGKGQTTGRVP